MNHPDKEDYSENQPITLEVALDDLSKVLRWLYFHSMICSQPQTSYESLKEVVSAIFDNIHNKYEDHVEGIRRDFV